VWQSRLPSPAANGRPYVYASACFGRPSSFAASCEALMSCGSLPEGASGVHRAEAAARKVGKGCRRGCRMRPASVVPVGPSRADPLLAEAPRAADRPRRSPFAKVWRPRADNCCGF
jgi:hypothetical protein